MNNWHLDEAACKGPRAEFTYYFRKGFFRRLCHLCKNIGLLKGYCGMQVALRDEEKWYFNEENAECIQTSPGII